MIDPEHDLPIKQQAEVLGKWYGIHLRLDLKSLPAWSLIDELRMLANTVKHAEGSPMCRIRLEREVSGI
jgi:hypothetical protein